MATITVRDETFPGRRAAELTLDFLAERVTVRELIRSRVYEEVTEFNASRALSEHPLVELSPAERRLNGQPGQTRKRLDWEQQYERALQAFRRSGFLLLVDGTQCDTLDAEIDLRADTRITFLRLVPLAGG